MLVEVFGAQWRRWTPLDTLQDRMAAHATTFCQRQGLDPALADVEGQQVEWAHAALLEIIVHLGHIRFGRPKDTWREEMAKYYVGFEAAVEAVEKAKGEQRGGAGKTNGKKKAAAMLVRLKVHEHKAAGMPPKEIAVLLSISLPTVYRHLKAGLSAGNRAES